MSEVNETPNDEAVDTDLDQFADELFGQSEPAPVEANPEADEKVEADPDAPNVEEAQVQDENDGDDDTPAPEDEEDDEQGDPEDEGKPAPKKNRAKERIDELTGKYREEERKRIELENRIRELEAGQKKNEEPEPKTSETSEGPAAPTPKDVDENGKEKYPLGEFDPKYLSDLVEYKVSEATAQQRKALEEAEKQEQQKTAQSELQANWMDRTQKFAETKPDFVEKTQTMLDGLGEVGDDYGEYLAATIMSMDNGPEVLYYLAENPDEAREIVHSGPTKATMALGRIDGQIGGSKPQPKAAKPSSAPTPPPMNKGSSVARPKVDPSTDDLDSFEKIFFKD